MVESIRVCLRGVLLAIAMLLAAQVCFASEFGPGGFIPPPDPGPPVDPPPPAVTPVDPTVPYIYGTSVQLGLQASSYTMYMLSHKFWPTILGPDMDGGLAMTRVGSATHVAAQSPDSDFRLVSYESASEAGAVGGDWNNTCDQDCCCMCPDRQLWLTGYGVGGNAHNGDTGVGFGLGAVQFGFERAIDCDSVHGLFGEYVDSTVDVDLPAQSIEARNLRLGLYRRHEWDRNYYLVAGALSTDWYDSRRDVEVPTTGTVRGDYDGWQGIAYAERGITLRNCDTGLQPYVALQYIYLRQNGFSETGVSGADLDVPGVDANSLRSMLGARYQRRLAACLSAQLRAAWWHEFLDTDTIIAATISGGPGVTIQGLDLGRDWALTGVGLAWDLGNCWSTYGAYDAQFNDRQVFHLGSGGVQYSW